MDTVNSNLADDSATEEDREQVFHFWTDEGARRFNKMIEEGGTYLADNPHLAERFGDDSDGDECECLYPDLCGGMRRLLSLTSPSISAATKATSIHPAGTRVPDPRKRSSALQFMHIYP